MPWWSFSQSLRRKGGNRIPLADHMRKVWTEINFSPNSFELPESVDEARDIPIFESSTFEQIDTHQIDSNGKNKTSSVTLGQTQPIEGDRYTGLKINNFPLEMTNEDVIKFINEKVSVDIPNTEIDIVRNKKSSNATISKGLDTTSITKAMECIDFLSSKNLILRLPLYCRPIRELTPEKLSEDGAASSSQKSQRSPLPRIPGLPPKAQRQAIAKERLKQKQSAEKDKSKIIAANEKKSAFDVLMQNSRKENPSPIKSPVLSLTAKRGSSQLGSPSSPCDIDPKRNKNNTPQ